MLEGLGLQLRASGGWGMSAGSGNETASEHGCLGCPTVSLTRSSPNWAMPGPTPAFLPLGICEQWVAGRLHRAEEDKESPDSG